MPDNNHFSPDSILFNQSVENFVVIAHRGASYDYPENTMLAFQKAYEMRADMIELDVQLSSDGVPVVFHDSMLDDKTNGHGQVNRHTFTELQNLDAGSWFKRTYKGVGIPGLSEVLQWAKNKIALNIEIKKETAESALRGNVEKKVIQLLREHDMKSHTLISSFSYESVQTVKRLDPGIATGLLYDKKMSKQSPLSLLDSYQADTFNCKWRELKRSWRAELYQKNVPVLVYTVNHPFWMRRLIRAGINGIFTDRPDLLNQVAIQQIGN
jgi:glycerophosphoryl diester phosphodiesterase